MGRFKKKTTEITLGISDTGNKIRQGCGFTNNDLDNAVKASGLAKSAVEHDLKIGFKKAKAGGDEIKVYKNVSISKSPSGKVATLTII